MRNDNFVSRIMKHRIINPQTHSVKNGNISTKIDNDKSTINFDEALTKMHGFSMKNDNF